MKSELNDHHLNTDWGSMIDGMSSRQRVRLKPQGVWERLERLEMSQNTLARRIGVTQGFLSLLMNGRRSPSTETIGLMLKELDAPFDDLFVVVAREDIRREPARPKRRSNDRRNGRSNRDGKQLALPGLNVLPPGTTILPDNFPIRLVRIKEATGLTWNQFGEKIGVNPRQMLRWRNGAKPSGGGHVLPDEGCDDPSQLVLAALWRPQPATPQRVLAKCGGGLMTGPKGFYLWEVPGFPEDFPDRLERLKRASGLSWRQIAYWLGTDTGVIREWRAGRRQPSTVHLFSLFALAATVYGGCGILLNGVVEDTDVAGHPNQTLR